MIWMFLARLELPWRRALRLLPGALFTLAAIQLTGCGSEGAGAGGSAARTQVTQASDITLFVDKPVLPGSDNTTAAIVTAQVKDSANNALPNQKVAFSTADKGVTLSAVGTTTTTDAAGRMQVKVELGASSSARLNRSILVTATVGSLSRDTTIAVTGTRATLDGPSSLSAGAVADYTLAVLDGTNQPLVGLPVTVTFNGGTPASQQVTTGANGQASVRVTAATAGSSQISASALGIDAASRSVQILGTDSPLRISAPADNAVIDVNTAQTIRLLLKPNGVARVGVPVTVTATRGTFNGTAQSLATAITDANGEALVSIASAAVGPSAVSATAVVDGIQLTTSSRVSFVSRVAAKIALSPDVSSLSVNAAGSTSSSTRLVATVRDASDNLVTGATVYFSAVDPSAGSITPGSAVTDSNGQATASFIAGPTSTGPAAVVVKASVFNGAGNVVSDSRNMTVSAAALFVELGTGNSISAIDGTSYSMPWSAIVTDANRNPVAGAKVSATLVAVTFRKGVWFWNGASWEPRSLTGGNLLGCSSEDANGNNLLDTGEDVNGNGRLDPGSPATVQITSADGASAANGLAQLSVNYPKSFGEWVEVVMRVTIASSGTENTVSRQFYLPVLGADVNELTKAPPSVGARGPGNELVGPYGYVEDHTSVTDPVTGRTKQFCTVPN
jgi:hypothetical protein